MVMGRPRLTDEKKRARKVECSFSNEQLEKFDALCDKLKISRSAMLRCAFDEFLKKCIKDQPDLFDTTKGAWNAGEEVGINMADDVKENITSKASETKMQPFSGK